MRSRKFACAVFVALISSFCSSTPKDVVWGVLDRNLIEEELRGNLGRVRACYEAELQANPNLMGQMNLSWIINEDGKVRGESVEIIEDTIENDKLNTCIADVFKSLQFSPPSGGPVQVKKYPLNFHVSHKQAPAKKKRSAKK